MEFVYKKIFHYWAYIKFKRFTDNVCQIGSNKCAYFSKRKTEDSPKRWSYKRVKDEYKDRKVNNLLFLNFQFFYTREANVH